MDADDGALSLTVEIGGNEETGPVGSELRRQMKEELHQTMTEEEELHQTMT